MYDFDPTGVNPSNLIINELHSIGSVNGRDLNYFAAKTGPFFANSLVIVDANTGRELEQSEYTLGHKFEEASTALSRDVYYAVALTNPAATGSYYLRMQLLGGEFALSSNQLLNDGFFQRYLQALDSNRQEEWEISTLGKSCDFFNGKAHEKAIDINGDFVVVNSKFISTEGEVRKFTQNQIFPLFENDVVLVMSDVPKGKARAKCFLIDEDDKYSLNQRICAIRSDRFNSKFLYYQLNRNKHYLKFNNGENQTNLRKSDILDCPLIIPPIEIQNQIVEVLDRMKEITDQGLQYQEGL